MLQTIVDDRCCDRGEMEMMIVVVKMIEVCICPLPLGVYVL
jgi:hypothetical protein